MECELSKLGWDGSYYSVETDGRAIPAAFFICAHCADAWGKENFHTYHITKILDITARLQVSLPTDAAE